MDSSLKTGADDVQVVKLSIYENDAFHGKVCDEVCFLTFDDYIKYFGDYKDNGYDSIEDFIEGTWDCYGINVRNSRNPSGFVVCPVTVEFVDNYTLVNHESDLCDNNDGDRLIYTVIDELKYSHGMAAEEIKESIENNMFKLLDSLKELRD